MHDVPMHPQGTHPRLMALAIASLTLLVFAFALLSCSSAPVTLHGVPVHNEMVAMAARVAHTADLAAAAITRSVTAQWQAGKLDDATLRVYGQQVAPKVQEALDGLRRLLQEAGTAPTAAYQGQLGTGVALVQEALSLAQTFGADPVAWVAKNGGKP